MGVFQYPLAHTPFPVARVDAVVTPRPGAKDRIILPHLVAVDVDLVAVLLRQGGLLEAFLHLLEADPAADDDDVDHDQAGDQQHHGPWHFLEQDQGQGAGDEQAGKKGGVAHARAREHQGDDHDGQENAQRGLAAQDQRTDMAQSLPPGSGACAPPHRGDQQADADRQAQHQIRRVVVAIDEGATGDTAAGHGQREAAIDGLPQAAQHEDEGECLQAFPRVD